MTQAPAHTPAAALRCSWLRHAYSYVIWSLHDLARCHPLISPPTRTLSPNAMISNSPRTCVRRLVISRIGLDVACRQMACGLGEALSQLAGCGAACGAAMRG